MQSQPLTCSDLSELSARISISNNLLFNNHACVFDEDISEWPTSLSLARHLSHTRGISHFGDDDDVLAELSESADEADKWWRQAECVFTN